MHSSGYLQAAAIVLYWRLLRLNCATPTLEYARDNSEDGREVKVASDLYLLRDLWISTSHILCLLARSTAMTTCKLAYCAVLATFCPLSRWENMELQPACSA